MPLPTRPACGCCWKPASVQPWRWRTTPSWLRGVMWPQPIQSECWALFLESREMLVPLWCYTWTLGTALSREILPWIRINTQEVTLRDVKIETDQDNFEGALHWADPEAPPTPRSAGTWSSCNNGVGFSAWILTDITFSTRGCWILCYQGKSVSPSLIISLGYFRKPGTTKSRALFVRLCIHLSNCPPEMLDQFIPLHSVRVLFSPHNQ